MGNIRKIFTLVLTVVFISFFVAVLFGMGDVRGNLAGLVSTLFNEGLVGFLILIILLYIYYPVYKFFRAVLKIRSLKEALDKSTVKTKIETLLDRIVFGIVPAIYIIFIVFIK